MAETSEPFEDDDLQKMLEKAQTEESRGAYQCYKYLETHREKVSDFPNKQGLQAEVIEKLNSLTMEHVDGKSCVARLTTIQSLGRRLRLGEIRAVLAKKCIGILQSPGKQMFDELPQHFKDRLNAFAT